MTDTKIIYLISIDMKKKDLHEPNSLLDDEEINEILNMEPNWDEIERERTEYLQWLNDNSTVNYSQNNDYVTWAFDWLTDKLSKYHKTNSAVTAKYYFNGIVKFLNNLDGSRFTDSQWGVIERKVAAFHKMADGKDKYLNRCNKNECGI